MTSPSSRRADAVQGSQQAARDLEPSSGVGPALHTDEPTPYVWPLCSYLELGALPTDYTRVRIEVWDADPRPPAPKDPAADGMPDLEAESGRGLFLVAALSARWAWACTQEPAGKVVSCELDTEPLESSPESDGPAAKPRLPQRIPSAVQVRSAIVMNDPDILRRLRDGLRNLGHF